MYSYTVQPTRLGTGPFSTLALITSHFVPLPFSLSPQRLPQAIIAPQKVKPYLLVGLRAAVSVSVTSSLTMSVLEMSVRLDLSLSCPQSWGWTPRRAAPRCGWSETLSRP